MVSVPSAPRGTVFLDASVTLLALDEVDGDDCFIVGPLAPTTNVAGPGGNDAEAYPLLLASIGSQILDMGKFVMIGLGYLCGVGLSSRGSWLAGRACKFPL